MSAHYRWAGRVRQTFSTNVRYSNRETKATYVWEKYKPLLQHSVLDVGADQGFLRPHVTAAGGRYLGVGFGAGVDRELNLEAAGLPFEDSTFETVLCLDVLEHLEAAHQMFAHLCRVARRYVIISLPNPWANFWHVLRSQDYSDCSRIKFYGFPVDPPLDRHRWFFSEAEAKAFLRENAARHGCRILQMDCEYEGSLWRGGLVGCLRRWVFKHYFRRDIDRLGLTHGPIWCVLEHWGQP